MRATAARLLAFAATSLRSPVARLSLEGRAALLSQLAAGGSLTDKSKALIDHLTIANPSAPDPVAAVELWSGEFDLISYDALAGQLEDVRLKPLSGVARLADGSLELELDVQHRSGDNVGLTLSGTLAPVGAADLRVELLDGEVFARDVGDIGEMMETEARLRASLPPSVRATLTLAYLDDALLIARCTQHEETPPPKHWKCTPMLETPAQRGVGLVCGAKPRAGLSFGPGAGWEACPGDGAPASNTGTRASLAGWAAPRSAAPRRPPPRPHRPPARAKVRGRNWRHRLVSSPRSERGTGAVVARRRGAS